MKLPDYVRHSSSRILLWQALASGKQFHKHLAALEIGWHLSTADEVLTNLHRLGLVHIVGWTRNGDRGPMTKIVAFGPGEDRPRPAKLPGYFACKRWRARHPEQAAQIDRNSRLRRQAKAGKLPTGNDPLLMAIMGPRP